jgi:hypothetical protein
MNPPGVKINSRLAKVGLALVIGVPAGFFILPRLWPAKASIPGGASHPLRGASEPHSHAVDPQANAPSSRSGVVQPQGATDPLPALYRGSQGGSNPLPRGDSHRCWC